MRNSMMVSIFYQYGSGWIMDWNTRSTLLHKLRLDQPKAWEEFSEIYSSFIHSILQRMNLAKEDRDDILQEVLLTIHQAHLKGSAYQKRDHEPVKFRSWLAKVVRNTALNAIKRQKKHHHHLSLESMQEKGASATQRSHMYEQHTV